LKNKSAAPPNPVPKRALWARFAPGPFFCPKGLLQKPRLLQTKSRLFFCRCACRLPAGSPLWRAKGLWFAFSLQAALGRGILKPNIGQTQRRLAFILQQPKGGAKPCKSGRPKGPAIFI
jgi:hypothetical protein